jgi:predicted lysophospholipase L1 biosynthesis ABC-type transport system permease subunit
MFRHVVRSFRDRSGSAPLTVALVATALTVALSFAVNPLADAMEAVFARLETGLEAAGGAEDRKGAGCPTDPAGRR